MKKFSLAQLPPVFLVFFVVFFLISPAKAESPIPPDSEGWIVQTPENSPPDLITTTPEYPDGTLWVNPDCKTVQTNTIYIYVNGVPQFPDVEPYQDENYRTMVPVRTVAEALDSTLAWDSASGRVDITRKGSQLRLWIGKNIAEVNGREIKMDTQPVLKNNRTMVPLRFVGEAFGAEVVWSESDRKVEIALRDWE
ncbi:MAG TPA: copper amine oxidase N-terminal domain-containing protein [Bacillota bacterium]|nr:copper amine oxidase N-terminal domain-containing protein [Bacillota bacterium]